MELVTSFRRADQFKKKDLLADSVRAFVSLAARVPATGGAEIAAIRITQELSDFPLGELGGLAGRYGLPLSRLGCQHGMLLGWFGYYRGCHPGCLGGRFCLLALGPGVDIFPNAF